MLALCRDAFRRAHGHHIDWQVFVNLQINQPVDKDICDFIGVIDIDDGPHIDAIRIIGVAHGKGGLRIV